MQKSILKSILFLLLPFVARSVIRPTRHYLEHHSDVGWEMVLLTVLSPSRTRPNTRLGEGRYTYIKYFKRSVIEVHVRVDNEENVWVINAFQHPR